MIRIYCKENLRGKTLITGFLGLGHVGYLSIDHMINFLGANKTGFVETLSIPPFVGVKKNKFTIPYEFYKNGDAVFFRCEAIPTGRSGSRILRRVAKWAKKNKFSKMILIGGLSLSFKKEDKSENVRYLYNSSYQEEFGILKPYVQEGVQVVGPLAVLLYYAEVYQIPTVAILSYADSSRADPRGSANAVLAASKLLNLKMDVGDLLNRATDIEKEIETIFTKIRSPDQKLRNSDMYT